MLAQLCYDLPENDLFQAKLTITTTLSTMYDPSKLNQQIFDSIYISLKRLHVLE